MFCSYPFGRVYLWVPLFNILAPVICAMKNHFFHPFFLFCCWLLPLRWAQAQSADQAVLPMRTSTATFYQEFFGQGGLVSFNYDQRFGHRPNGWGFRAGIGGFSGERNYLVTVPVGMNYLFAKDSRALEVGLGATYAEGWIVGDPTLFGTLCLAYRYQPLAGGFNFRVAFTPLVGVADKKIALLPVLFGLSFGYTFQAISH